MKNINTSIKLFVLAIAVVALGGCVQQEDTEIIQQEGLENQEQATETENSDNEDNIIVDDTNIIEDDQIINEEEIEMETKTEEVEVEDVNKVE